MKLKLFVRCRKERGLYISDTSRAVAIGYQGYPRELPRGCEEATVRLCDRLQIGEGGTVRVEESVMQTGPKHTLYLAVGWPMRDEFLFASWTWFSAHTVSVLLVSDSLMVSWEFSSLPSRYTLRASLLSLSLSRTARCVLFG